MITHTEVLRLLHKYRSHEVMRDLGIIPVAVVPSEVYTKLILSNRFYVTNDIEYGIYLSARHEYRKYYENFIIYSEDK